MAKVRIMYWKEIPAQVHAEDASGRAVAPLEDRFQRGIDAIAMFDGSAGADEYITAWDWKDYGEVEGSAAEAAQSIANLINRAFPEDFVARIRDLQRAGTRNPVPGAVDDWFAS